MRYLILFTALAALTWSAGAGLILNGSFESPVISNEVTQVDAVTTFGDDDEWLVISGSIDLVRRTAEAYDGQQRISLNGSGPGKLGQAITTVANGLYKLTYYSLDNGYDFTVGLAQTSSGSYFSSVNVDSGSTGEWIARELEFTAAGETTWVIFESFISGGTGAGIDMVDVELVPEPATLVIFGLGGLMLTVTRRKI